MTDVESAVTSEIPPTVGGISDLKSDEDEEMAQVMEESTAIVTNVVNEIAAAAEELANVIEDEVSSVQTKEESGEELPDLATPTIQENPVVENDSTTDDVAEVTEESAEQITDNVSDVTIKCKGEEEEIEPEPQPENSKSVVPVEENDDIIILDDEDDDVSGATESKRPRKDNPDEAMEVDEKDVKSMGKVIRKMSRADLEDLVLAKIVEAIVAHTEVGQLRGKVLELQMQRDKMAGKMGIMLKQVAELSSAVNQIMENEQRNPNNRIAKPNVIRFNRSVGLQTSIEPSVRSAPPKIIRVPDASQNGVKQYGASVGKQIVGNGTFAPPPNQVAKRAYQPGKGVSIEMKPPGTQTLAITQSPRKTYSPATAPPRIHPIAPKPAVSQSVTVTQISQNVQPGIVDLTDDDPPAASSGPISSTTGNTTTIINGVQYQIVNPRPSVPGNVQIVSPTQSQPKYIVTPATGQTRPVLLQQVAVGSGSGSNQQLMIRGINNSSPVTIIQRPVAPRPANGNLPRVAATIPVRPAGNVVLGTASNTPRKFMLPALPSTPVPKAKNDMFRPPPKPELTLNEQQDGIVLSWNLPQVNNMAEVTTYQIFACQESLTASSLRPSQWKRVGDVKALPLPMACTLSQFTEENRYYFIVRGIDVYGRVGPFCDPQNILLRRKK